MQFTCERETACTLGWELHYQQRDGAGETGPHAEHVGRFRRPEKTCRLFWSLGVEPAHKPVSNFDSRTVRE